MKFLVPFALLAVVTGSSFLTPRPAKPAAAVSRPLRTPHAPAPASRLLRFDASPVAPARVSLLTDLYCYEGQYVRRGQVLAKLKTRPTNAVAYLTAPHDGVLSRPRFPVGTLLAAAAPLTTVTDQTRLHLRPARPDFRAGDSVRVALLPGAARPVPGKVVAASAAELTVQLRRAVAGATVGSRLALTPNEDVVQQHPSRADKAAGPRRAAAVAWARN